MFNKAPEAYQNRRRVILKLSDHVVGSQML